MLPPIVPARVGWRKPSLGQAKPLFGRNVGERFDYTAFVLALSWHGDLGRESARAGCPCHSGRDARTTPHARTPSAAGPLFSITFSLCSGDFGVSPAFSSAGLSVRASSPTTLLSSSAARSSGSLPGGLASWVGARHGVTVRAVREPPR